jgi:hypothetical protein
MAVCFFEVSKPYKRDSNALPDATSPKRIASDNSSDPQASEDDATKKLALKLLAKFDTNGDQCISQDEATRVFQDYAFRRFDRDSDGKLTIDELTLTFRDQRVQ